MKCLRILSIINGLFLSSNVAATTLITSLHSNYIDFTHNTAWVSEMQDMGPDLVTPEQPQGYSSDKGEEAIEDTTDIQQFLQEIYLEKIPSVLWQFIEMPSMIGVNNVNRDQFTLNNSDQVQQIITKNQLDLFYV
ncbi:hypothetical protein TUM19329_11820 [Legionella antarctica]|uniref:Uncharacterized protein n=1 Tax=Legionella antarctica TaxID=2708020 RepID=A0A6F8T2X8_9GAMM|nr:hypothetical protein [Legionella antarctica]BCA94821.1 hypothetical protein TUM19329_11820 [Legionella antarctica]